MHWSLALQPERLASSSEWSMSGRSGYRKTDRKRNRFARPAPPKADYVLRFALPAMFAAFVAPGGHGFGVAVGFNDIVFVSGQHPAHCCQLAADFLDRIGARQHPQTIAAQVVKLLPCSAHCAPVPGFRQIGSAIDLEAIHDRVSRFKDRARACTITVRPEAIAFSGGDGWRAIIHDYSDEHRRHRSRA
jgi:hypothetical protein